MSIALIALAAFLTWLSWHKANILTSLSAGLLWFGIAMWIFFASTPVFDLAEVYSKILVWVFFMLMFVPFLALMNTEIQVEKNGKKWREWGSKPKEKVDNYEAYRSELRRRINRRR
jgi:multisubunit Na+/H+ antiporter MnhG subunit